MIRPPKLGIFIARHAVNNRQEKMCVVINTTLKCPSCKGMARKYSKTYPCASPGKCNVEIKDDSRENSCTYCDQCRPSNWDSE